MRTLLRALTHLSINANSKTAQLHNPRPLLTFQQPFSTQGDGGEKEADWTAHFGGAGSSAPDPMGWDAAPSSWSTGLTKEHFDGEVVGKRVAPDSARSQPGPGGSARTHPGGYSDARWTDDEMSRIRELEAANRQAKDFVDSWDEKMAENALLMKQVKIGADFILLVGILYHSTCVLLFDW